MREFANKFRIVGIYLINKLLIRPFLRIYYICTGYKVVCNICGWKDNQFLSDGWHKHIVCQNCKSEVKHRLLFALLNKSGALNHNKLLDGKKILYFAPDSCLINKFKKFSNQIVTADMFAEGYKYKNIDLTLDISNMSQIQTRSFDCLVAIDVLEHVPDHLKAMDEIYRVLREGGCCILAVPQKDGLIKTIEDDKVIEPIDRERKFGQKDHLRIYGSDFEFLLEQSGFVVEKIDDSFFDKEMVAENVLRPPLLSKREFATNYRNIFVGFKLKD